MHIRNAVVMSYVDKRTLSGQGTIGWSKLAIRAQCFLILAGNSYCTEKIFSPQDHIVEEWAVLLPCFIL